MFYNAKFLLFSSTSVSVIVIIYVIVGIYVLL